MRKTVKAGIAGAIALAAVFAVSTPASASDVRSGTKICAGGGDVAVHSNTAISYAANPKTVEHKVSTAVKTWYTVGYHAWTSPHQNGSWRAWTEQYFSGATGSTCQ